MEPESLIIDENITEDEIFVIDENTAEEEITEFLRQVHAPEGPTYWTVSENGSMVEVGAPIPRKRAFVFRDPAPPEQPEWIRRLNAQARFDAIQAREAAAAAEREHEGDSTDD